MRLDPHHPFRYADGLAAGLTPAQLRGPRFRVVLRGVYVAADTKPDELDRVRAALLVHPDSAFASHVSAARVYGAPLPAGLDDEHVSVLARADRRRREGVRSHLAPTGASVVVMRGLRTSCPEQAFVELAEQLSLVDLVVVGDHLVRRGWTTPARLAQHAGARGGTRARRAAGHVRGEVDSPMETRLRMLIVLAGLPEPVVNFVVRKADGRVRYRFDLCYPDLKVVVEYDGRHHRADLDQWDRDLERAEWVDEDGWRYVPVHSRGIYRRPDQTLLRVRKALESRGAAVPRTLSDAWRAHFPVRP